MSFLRVGHIEFKSGCSSAKAEPGGTRLLSTCTRSARTHLTWEIPKGDQQ